jgi:hypothetical protein
MKGLLFPSEIRLAGGRIEGTYLRSERHPDEPAANWIEYKGLDKLTIRFNPREFIRARGKTKLAQLPHVRLMKTLDFLLVSGDLRGELPEHFTGGFRKRGVLEKVMVTVTGFSEEGRRKAIVEHYREEAIAIRRSPRPFGGVPHTVRAHSITPVAPTDREAQMLQREVESLRKENETLRKEYDELRSDYRSLNHQLESAHGIIKRQRQSRHGRPTEEELRSVAEQTRKKSGKLNYAAIGRQFGVTPPAARSWCQQAKIKLTN